MRQQYRLISSQALLSAVGLSRNPLRVAPAVAALSDDPQRFQDALQYIERIDRRNPIQCPDFPHPADWINSRPLSLRKELARKLVLIDFFAYCCINCHHILPKLSQLENKYGANGSGGVVVVGVHSAKFSAERETRNVAAAVERYDVRHPVINDEDLRLWNALGVSSWPTLALLGPRGNLLALWTGERQEEDIDLLISAALEYYGGAIDHRALPKPPESNITLKKFDNKLRYPGKVAVGANGLLHVADTGNHRIVQLNPSNGKVLKVFGNGEPGLLDSDDANRARFHSPQGIVEWDGVLYVADTENHAVRAVNLAVGSVGTIGGTGEQGFDYSGGKVGTKQALSSPWDVEVTDGVLYVAMAGTHQLWSLKLPGKVMGGLYSEPWHVFSGSGRELEKNAENGRLAGWAQPSHLSASSNGIMFVADSESSSVRAVDTNTGSHPTRTLAGGDGLLAENLFAFGDKEGKGANARFQHPLAVCFDDARKLLYVADSYNHRIKVIDESGAAKVFCGSGSPGLHDGDARSAMFWEPGGLALSADGSKLYVADTNNFVIRVIDTSKRKVSTLEIVSALPQVAIGYDDKPLVSNRRRAVRIVCGSVQPMSRSSFEIAIPEKSHFTPGVTSRYQVNINRAVPPDRKQGPLSVVCLEKGETKTKDRVSSFDIDLSAYSNKIRNGDDIEVEAVTYYCTEEDDVCRTEADIFNLKLSQDATDAKVISHNIVPKKLKTTVV